MNKSKAQMLAEEKAIEEKFTQLKSKCPAIAEANAATAKADARTKADTKGAAGRSGSKNTAAEPAASGSTITGGDEDEKQKEQDKL